MSVAETIALLTGGAPPPALLLDLTLWHRWHAHRGTLPERWRGATLEAICRDLGVPTWQTVKPWRLDLPGIGVERSESSTERMVRWAAPSGELTSRWVLGPDGDWWQSEYPVKSAADLAAAREVVGARRYATVPPSASDGAGGIPEVLELPMRPYAELLHAFFGWSEGLMLMLEEPGEVQHLIDGLESRLLDLVRELCRLPGAVVLAPDNLDGQFVAPAAFEEHLQASYRRDAELLHAAGKRLVVHVGGPARGLLAGLGRAGVDAVEGVCGPPQGDAGIAEARALTGANVALWGGVAQDWLLAATDGATFEGAARAALGEARSDGGSILGVADRVPVEALPERLVALARMAREG